ncbi:hypothetical protein AAMO2058_000990000 [Amorphochlora amoebiformis]
MGFLFQDEFDALEWQAFIFVVVVLGVVLFFTFGVLHTLNFAFGEQARRRNSIVSTRSKLYRTLHNTILGFFMWHMFPGSILFSCYLHFDVDESLTNCSWIYPCSITFYVFSNFLVYSVMISKSQLYDPMSQMKRLYTVTWWIIHGMYLPISILIIIYVALTKRQHKMVEGKQRCIEGAVFGIQVAMVIFDSLVSILCIIILAGPTIVGGTVSLRVRKNVYRGVLLTSIAAITTFLNLIYSIFHSGTHSTAGGVQEEDFIVQMILQTTAIDIVINFTCITLCWPVAFYIQAAKSPFKVTKRLSNATSQNNEKRRRSSGSGSSRPSASRRPRSANHSRSPTGRFTGSVGPIGNAGGPRGSHNFSPGQHVGSQLGSAGSLDTKQRNASTRQPLNLNPRPNP